MIIGITGGVGCGKSAVISYLEENFGALVLLADDISKEVSEKDPKVLSKIRVLFRNDDALTPEGIMDRPKVAAIIFADAAKRMALDDIIHPAVDRAIRLAIERQTDEDPDRLIVIESALLFEAGLDELCDKTVYIFATEETRLSRLLEKRGYSTEKSKAIMAKQLSEKEFRERCDITIDNNGTKEGAFKQISDYISCLI